MALTAAGGNICPRSNQTIAIDDWFDRIKPSTATPTLSSPASVPRTIEVPKKECAKCGQKFESRNALFSHLRSERHGVYSKHLSPFLASCRASDWETACNIWHKRGPCIDVNESTDACETALHLIAKQWSDMPSSIQDILVQLASNLIGAGASAHVLSRPDTMWGDSPPISPESPTSALTLARDRLDHNPDPRLVRVLVGVTQDQQATLCDCCGEEFFYCCQQLEPALPKCGHTCCAATLVGWFAARAREGDTFDSIGCPVCLAPVSEPVVTQYLKQSNQAILDKLIQQSLEVAVSRIPGWVWCPRCPSGGIAVCDEAVCHDCGYAFCTHCKHNWDSHVGMSCNELLHSYEGKSIAWIEANCRQCPKCHTAITHSGGCSHMTCRSCQHSFCWLCLGNYKGALTMTPSDLLKKARSNVKQVLCPCGNPVKSFSFNRSR